MHTTTITAIGVFVLDVALQVSGYQNPTVAVFLAVVGVGLLLYPKASELVPEWWRNRWGKKKSQVPEGFTPVKDAAASLYAEARSSKHVMARMAEEASGWGNGNLCSGSPNDILDWMATYIVHGKKIPIYGKRPPSMRQEQIDIKDVRASVFADGATKLRQIHDEKRYFVDLEIKSKDLEQLIFDTQVNVGFYESNS